ncbi:type II toxin-antitoxin system Phd/YefM family antitoxin [Microbispora sp. NBRC 16548]|uniref:type II toxin-antitoxin system Phd/YefM family antitoxin n=1 Tax=Microbispora sp. NBRC 16548 TaxID=3030994 RepID=UPI001617F2A1|nr:type II toxin-antitoxin system Phd/YefM family antitoxin [Microbispora sp. NBRC 16548]
MSEAAREIPLEELHAHPERWDEAVVSASNGQVVTVTGNGKRLAAVVPADQPDLIARLRETIEVLSDNDALQAVIESRASIARGEGLRGREAIRGLLDGRQ